jgi:hypothetical protein
MTQRISIAEELAENIRCLQMRVEEACEDGRITDMERALLRREFASTKAQVRLVVSAQSTATRIMRTGHLDKNQVTEWRALDRDEDVRAVQAERGRVLQFTAHAHAHAHAQRHAAGGREPDGAA